MLGAPDLNDSVDRTGGHNDKKDDSDDRANNDGDVSTRVLTLPLLL